jgi:hypothetical protein
MYSVGKEGFVGYDLSQLQNALGVLEKLAFMPPDAPSGGFYEVFEAEEMSSHRPRNVKASRRSVWRHGERRVRRM